MNSEAKSNQVVGLFDQHQDAQEAVDRLMVTGIGQDRISVVQNRAATDTERHTRSNQISVNRNTLAGLGAGGLAGLLLSLGALSSPELRDVFGTGMIPIALMGAGVGAIGGGIIGSMNNMGVTDCRKLYREAIERGATIVTVTASGQEAINSGEVMKQSGALCVDLDGGPQRQGGWQEVPSKATPDAPKPANQPKVNAG